MCAKEIYTSRLACRIPKKQRDLGVHAKETYMYTKETYVYAKETSICAKEIFRSRQAYRIPHINRKHKNPQIAYKICKWIYFWYVVTAGSQCCTGNRIWQTYEEACHTFE